VKYNKLHDAFDARAVLREIGKSGSGFNEAVVKNTSEGHVDEAFRVYSDERAQAALEAAGYQREHEDGDEIVHWPGFLVSNRVTSITAEESTALPFLVDLAARATTGRTWLDGAENESTLDVIFVSSANKVLDLFRQFGGDTKKFHCLRSFDFDQANGVIDALPNFDVESFVLMLCPLEVSNINDDAAARKTLERMRRLMYAPIVYCVAPSTRSKGTRGRGAPAWTTASDTQLALTEHKHTTKLTRGDGQVLAYQLEKHGLALKDLPTQAASETDRAMAWLGAALAGGPRFKSELVMEAAKAGIALRTLDRAREALDVQTKRENKIQAKTLWALP